ncbi:hypothetical protein FSP39_022229 [Pinctada imbricata]|uniref:Aminotransferase class V domain-containing protein n=1 Tax=Pinctada imbricata TaxID=66713 RepID=A0AA88YAF2_PINIB|nr:hypothetical protein FSP39_022229 [Pinctada imbricata]
MKIVGHNNALQSRDNSHLPEPSSVSPRKSFDKYPVLGSPPSNNTEEKEDKDNHITEKSEGLFNDDQSADSMTGDTKDAIPDKSLEQKENHTLSVKESFTINYKDTPILRFIQNNVIGHLLQLDTPFGKRGVVYCDYTASGRCLMFIEDFIRNNVFPTYANTHSTTGFNARQTGKYREESRNIIRKCVHAGRDDAVIFTGSGATSGIHKVAWGLKINNPRIAAETVVFIGPYEHHSNILPWREHGVHVVRIHEDKKGRVDFDHLTSELTFWKEKRRYLIVSISAASNVTGIITDTEEVARLAHKHGALVVFDYAAGGPYLEIDMNPSKTTYKDAVIISPHKFVGGPGTPGIVIAKKWIFRNAVPHNVGGGTVSFVTKEVHTYVSNIEEREEGGTPAIIESIRAGLVFKLKSDIGADVIHAREQELCRRALEVWEKNPNMFILGNHNTERVAIFSFMTHHEETGRLVHFNFISALLSDLFGIQARGGCACAGPYAQDLLGISTSVARKFTWFLSEKSKGQDSSHPESVMGIMKPGFTRINLSYFYDDETIDYVIQAVDLVNRHGWKLLPKYEFDVNEGSWRHVAFTSSTNGTDLGSLDACSWKSEDKNTKKGPMTYTKSLEKTLAEGKEILESADSTIEKEAAEVSKQLRRDIPKDKRGLRFFLTPLEASKLLAQNDGNVSDKKRYPLPFKLREYSFAFESNNREDDAVQTNRSVGSFDDVRKDKEQKTQRNLSKKDETK